MTGVQTCALPISPDPGYCAYGATRIRERVRQLAGEIEGVRKAEDIEAVHRMRVASRRIRAALPLFSCCIPQKKYLRWTREIRDITRALGDARDKDVQIEFLTSYRKRFPLNGKGNPEQEYLALFHIPSEPCISDEGQNHQESCIVPRREYGIDCLLLRYHQERTRLQAPVRQALRRLEKDKTLKRMDTFFRKWESDAGSSGKTLGCRIASKRIGSIITELRKYAESLSDTERKDDHHQMRIIAKQLRYTMELYGDLYEGGLKKEIQNLRHLQDLLGEIHDCDVWIELLPHFLEEEAGRVESYFGKRDFLRLIEPGIEDLLTNRSSERDDLFRKLGITWKDLEVELFWEGLLRKVYLKTGEFVENHP